MTSMKSLAARLLGEFAIDGVESTALGSRKARLALPFNFQPALIHMPAETVGVNWLE